MHEFGKLMARRSQLLDLSFFCSLAPKIWLWPLWSIKNSVQPLCNLYTLLVLWVWASKLHHFISFPVCYRSFMWVRQEVDAGGQIVKLMKLRTHFFGRLNRQWVATDRVHWVNVMGALYPIWPPHIIFGHLILVHIIPYLATSYLIWTPFISSPNILYLIWTPY